MKLWSSVSYHQMSFVLVRQETAQIKMKKMFWNFQNYFHCSIYLHPSCSSNNYKWTKNFRATVWYRNLLALFLRFSLGRAIHEYIQKYRVNNEGKNFLKKLLYLRLNYSFDDWSFMVLLVRAHFSDKEHIKEKHFEKLVRQLPLMCNHSLQTKKTQEKLCAKFIL